MTNDNWPNGPDKERILLWERKRNRKLAEHPIAIHLRENLRERVKIERTGVEPSEFKAYTDGEEALEMYRQENISPSEGSPTEILHMSLEESVKYAMSGLPTHNKEQQRSESHATIAEIEYILSGHKDLPFNSQQEAWENFNSSNTNRSSREAIKRAISKVPEIVRMGSTRNSVYVYDPLQTGEIERSLALTTMILCTKGGSPGKLNKLANSELGWDGEEAFIDDEKTELPSKYMGNGDWRGRLLQRTGDHREEGGLFPDIHSLISTLNDISTRKDPPIQFHKDETIEVKPDIWSTRENERISKNLTISKILAGLEFDGESTDYSIVFDTIRNALDLLSLGLPVEEEGWKGRAIREWWEQSFGEIPPPQKHRGKTSDSMITEIALWHMFHCINEAIHSNNIKFLRDRQSEHLQNMKKRHFEYFKPLSEDERHAFFKENLDRFRELPNTTATKPVDFDSFDMNKLVEASKGLHRGEMKSCIDEGLMDACGDWENVRPLEPSDWITHLEKRPRQDADKLWKRWLKNR